MLMLEVFFTSYFTTYTRVHFSSTRTCMGFFALYSRNPPLKTFWLFLTFCCGCPYERKKNIKKNSFTPLGGLFCFFLGKIAHTSEGSVHQFYHLAAYVKTSLKHLSSSPLDDLSGIASCLRYAASKKTWKINNFSSIVRLERFNNFAELNLKKADFSWNAWLKGS